MSSPTDRMQAETAARDVIVKAIGGLLVFVTAFVSVENLRATEEKQIAERFSKAVEMLGHEENVHIRLGGIYALERIAMDSRKDHYPVMQVLAAFIRTKTSVVREQVSDTKQQDLHQYEEFSSARDHHEQEEEERFGGHYGNYEDMCAGEYEYFIGALNEGYVPNHSVDVQVAVSAIGRRNLSDSSSYFLDLSKTLLEGIAFEGNYENVNFYKAHFKDCIFGTQSGEKYTSFRDDDFREAIFEKVEFKHSTFRKTRFNNSVFVSTTFKDTDLTGADLTKTQFSGGTKICGCKFIKTNWTESSIGGEIRAPKFAYFTGKSEVRDTDFKDAKFTKANLVNALFKKGSYQGTSFEKAALSGVTFEDVNLRNSSFIGAQIGHESKLYMGYEQYGSRKRYQENYSDEVSFVDAGIKRADLEKGKAIIIEANFN
ncbi:pentapeptide repeat-containing protein [Leptolyngbya sp. BC1307]|uniref:pentapeptide repeat-containing protein n=1 Tax=Leptolyngbya sp. BC1307 TaxID=2029589 RepID=UPI001482BFE2|nr:pentapeptide repeat-containing protein [Leptolyngbya sp. BC1307]